MESAVLDETFSTKIAVLIILNDIILYIYVVRIHFGHQ